MILARLVMQMIFLVSTSVFWWLAMGPVGGFGAVAVLSFIWIISNAPEDGACPQCSPPINQSKDSTSE